MKNDVMQDFAKICRKNGWKRTVQRWTVFEFMRDNYGHPTVDAVWEHVRKTCPNTTRESVYRILNEFSEHGMLNRLDWIELARYDCRTSPHGHFICRRCGSIFDFPLPDEIVLPAEFDPSSVRMMELRASGVCPKCRRREQNDAPGKEGDRKPSRGRAGRTPKNETASHERESKPPANEQD